ncbi:MAG: polysaccharide biosynthesis protein, partial [Oscillospiraceae bacterium]|nr:polysaccharide biosynthesis protein [Oscillospiraceae bacterium]
CRHLIIFDICENGLFELGNELKRHYPDQRFTAVVGSVRDAARLSSVVSKFRLQIVLHAAAHKHVPMMQGNPIEAIKNNIFGTNNVIHVCVENQVEKFILISTDKAVNPVNVMGATKRFAEILMQTYSSEQTEMAAVRFGNVLGSAGSVIPVFVRQIAEGGPVTVTHKDIERYFMTIPEAVSLVLQTGALAKSGGIFVLDMGEPVKIYDLACDLIKLSGLRPHTDIDVNITGLRPGEKLYEELRFEMEDFDTTSHKKIFVCRAEKPNAVQVERDLNILQDMLDEEDEEAVGHTLLDIVKSYVPDGGMEPQREII